MNATLKRSWSILLQTVPGASRPLFLSAAACLVAAPSLQALIDINENGASDLWERNYNDGNLYSTFDPNADPDGDGWTNEIEAISGTDPGDGNPPDGFLHPEIIHHPAVYESPEEEGDPPILSSPEIISINWLTLAGKQYTLFSSPDLSPGSWTQIDQPRTGSGSILGASIPLTQPDGSIPDKLFWRVNITELDSDSDGLSDFEEYLAGTDPVISDSDGDTLSDSAEILAGTNPNNPDADGDGLTDPFEIAAGTDSNSQDSDGDGIPDSIDGQPLISALEFADADGDGIPDESDPHPQDPRGPSPSLTSETSPGNPLSNFLVNETVRLVINVSNPNGPMPDASNLTFFINGTEKPAQITSISQSPPSSRKFLLSWDASTTDGYPARTLQNLTLRFRDAQQATSWLKLARIDVAEWEGMIAGMSCNGLNSVDLPTINVISHHSGVKQVARRLVYGSSLWYRGSKAIPLLENSGLNTGATAQIGAERYPLFLVSKSGAAYAVEQTLDISDPVAYPHHGYFYMNRTSAAITMSPATVGSIVIPGSGNKFQPFPQAPETGTPNIGVSGTSFINGEESTIYSAVWELLNASGTVRILDSLKFTSVTYGNGTSGVATDGTGGVRAGISAAITPHTAGTLEHHGLPMPSSYHTGPTHPALLPLGQETWHKVVLKVGPDAETVSNGIGLWLRNGQDGDAAPQTGFALKIANAQGTLTDFTIPAEGKITLDVGTPNYQQLLSPAGLTVFIKRDENITDTHELSLQLLKKREWYPLNAIQFAAIALVPVAIVPDDNMAGVVGEVIASVDPASKIKHFVSPKATTELPQPYVILKATGVTKEQITPGPNQILEWDGGEELDPPHPLKRRVTRGAADMKEVKIKAKQGGATAVQMDVWVVWANMSGRIQGNELSPNNDISFADFEMTKLGEQEVYFNREFPQLDGTVDRTFGHLFISGIEWKASILPIAMFDLDSDIPNLTESTPKDQKPPLNYDGGRAYYTHWDVPRFRKETKILDGNVSEETEWTIDDDVNATRDEDPYEQSTDREESAEIFSIDSPGADTMRIEHAGEPVRFSPDGNSFEVNQVFQEWARVRLGNKWFDISDRMDWYAHVKIQRTNNEWHKESQKIGIGIEEHE